jgi:hypothetical protein
MNIDTGDDVFVTLEAKAEEAAGMLANAKRLEGERRSARWPNLSGWHRPRCRNTCPHARPAPGRDRVGWPILKALYRL